VHGSSAPAVDRHRRARLRERDPKATPTYGDDSPEGTAVCRNGVDCPAPFYNSPEKVSTTPVYPVETLLVPSTLPTTYATFRLDLDRLSGT
jgi:hypothetical protein